MGPDHYDSFAASYSRDNETNLARFDASRPRFVGFLLFVLEAA